jgi:chromosomal replication initiator protein
MSQEFSFSQLSESVRIMSTMIRKQDFLTYFKKFSLIASTDSSVVLGVISTFHKDNLSKKFYNEIKSAIQIVSEGVDLVDFVVDDRIEVRPDTEVVDCRTTLRESEKQTKKEQVEGVEIVDGVNSRLVNDRYRLDNFIIGPSSQLAHAACEAVVRRP